MDNNLVKIDQYFRLWQRVWLLLLEEAPVD